MISASSAFD